MIFSVLESTVPSDEKCLWFFASRTAEGEVALYGTFKAPASGIGVDWEDGVCWDARANERFGQINGRFMKSPEPAGVRLFWTVMRFEILGAKGLERFHNAEPYSGVAVATDVASSGVVYRFSGPLKVAMSSEPPGEIEFVRSDSVDSRGTPPELLALFRSH